LPTGALAPVVAPSTQLVFSQVLKDFGVASARVQLEKFRVTTHLGSLAYYS